MSPGQQLDIQWFLPTGVKADDVYILITGIAAFLVVFLVGSSFIQRDTMGPRIRAIQERRKELKGALVAPRRRSRQQEGSLTLMRAVVNKLHLIQQNQVDKMKQALVNAGWRKDDAIYIFTFFQLVAPIVFLLVSFFVVKIDFADPLASRWKLTVPLLFAYAGLKLPNLLLINARTKRYDKIQKALSDSLDLMMICAEAGLSLSASLDRVSRELGLAYPEMAEELSLTAVELGFLPERKQALNNLVYRVDMPEVRGIVSVLVQTEKYGTPIAQALRVLAAEFRTQRMLRAEQKAARLPAIMTIPMVVFILPTLFVVIISPAIIRVLDTWK